MRSKFVKDLAALPPENPETQAAETAIFAAELGGSAETLDLHGLNRNEAEQAMLDFLNHEFADPPGRKDVKVVKIIHGGGEGVLKKMVADYLSGQGKIFVLRYRQSEDLRQAHGAVFAALAPNS